MSKKANRESCAVTNDLCSINLLNICEKKKDKYIILEKKVRVASLTSRKDAQKKWARTYVRMYSGRMYSDKI